MPHYKPLRSSVCAAFLLLGAGVVPSADAAYVFTDLTTLGGGYSTAAAINNVGQVSGASETYNGSYFSTTTLWNGPVATNLGILGPVGTGSLGYSINNAGQVAGTLVRPGYCPCLFPMVWDGTTSSGLVSLGNESVATSINNSGQVAGWTLTTSYYFSAYHATVWDGSTTTILGSLGGNNSFANAINDSGWVAGYSDTGGDANQVHATLWNGLVITDLGTLGGGYSSATAINNAGQVAGSSLTAGDVSAHATVWNGSILTDLGPGAAGGTDSWANAINNSGQVAGVSNMTGNVQHATIWNGTTAIDLNSLLDADTVSAGWVLNHANGINDNGWIVGDASNSLTGQRHGFLLSTLTVPEPGTFALLAFGLAGLCVSRLRHKLT